MYHQLRLNGRHLSLSLWSVDLALGDVTKICSDLLAHRVCGVSGEDCIYSFEIIIVSDKSPE